MFFYQHLFRYVSTASVIIEVVVIVVITVYAKFYSVQDNDVVPFRDAKSERLRSFVGPNVFLGLSSFFFAYIGQHASFEMYASLRKPCLSKWRRISSFAVVTAGCCSDMLSTSTWLNLGDSVQGNVLDTFSPDDKVINFCRVMLGMILFLTYPIDFFVVRQNINRAIFVEYLGMPDYMGWLRFYLITFIFWAISVTIGKLTTSVHYFSIVIFFFFNFCLLFCSYFV